MQAPCHFGAGKWANQSTVNNLSAGPNNALLHVFDSVSRKYFLVDTGSALSILPPCFAKALKPSNQPLVAANGTPIKSFGTRQIELQLGLQRYTWRFIVAKVTQCILGGDFLRSHSLLVDLANRRLIRSDNLKIVKGSPSPHQSFHISSLAPADKYLSLLRSRPALTTPTFSASLPKHGVQHRIPTTGFPVHSQARRLSPEKFKISKEEFDTLVKLGIARRSNSPYSSPLHVVPKPCGGWHPCGDYRRLNECTEFDRYPIPRIHDFMSNLAGKVVFSKVDLIKGYHQIPIHPDDVPKTAVITPFGLFEFLRMPMGLKNAAQAFQRLMDSVCAGLDFVFAYLDDILIASESETQHLEHLGLLFDRLEENGLVVKVEKCLLGVPEIDFLGHRVSRDGILPLPAKVKVISNFPAPTTITALEQFVGMVNFYHVFVPKAAEVMKPLYKALSTKPRPKELDWTPELDLAFRKAKQLLADATLLHHPVPGARTVLTTVASDIAIGGVLEQKIDGNLKPLAFFSRQLNKAEKNYSTIDRELLGIHSAILHFRYFLEGRDFTVYTDHKPLVAAMKKKSELKSGRQSRHLATISEFTTDIQHVTGKENVVADALSRAPVSQLTVKPRRKATLYQVPFANLCSPSNQGWTTGLWPPINKWTQTYKTTARPFQISVWRTSRSKTVLSASCVTCPQEKQDRSCQKTGADKFSTPFTRCLTREQEQRRSWCLPSSCGMDLEEKSRSGPVVASRVNGRRSTVIQKHHCPSSSRHPVPSNTFTSTWLVPYRHPRAKLTSSRRPTVSLDGWKLYPSEKLTRML